MRKGVNERERESERHYIITAYSHNTNIKFYERCDIWKANIINGFNNIIYIYALSLPKCTNNKHHSLFAQREIHWLHVTKTNSNGGGDGSTSFYNVFNR